MTSAATLVGVVAVAGILYWRGSGEPGLADPATVELPAAPTSAATATFLGGSGRDLMSLHTAAGRLLEAPQPAADLTACRRIATRHLAAAGSPRSLGTLAARVPDRDTGAMFASELQAVVDLVASCPTGTGVGTAREALAFHHTVVARRLEQVTG